MTQIPKDVSQVPVRRYSGEEKKTILSIPQADMERDSSDVYQRLHTSMSPSTIDAHGIALVSLVNSPSQIISSTAMTINYVYLIDSSTKRSDNPVPVINNQTSDSGITSVDRYC